MVTKAMWRFLLLPLTFVTVGCAGVDYNALSTYEIMNMGYNELCDHASSRHPRIMQEVERRQLTCDRAIDYCTHDMGLRHGTGDFANCVVGVKSVEAQERSAYAQERMAREQAEANNLVRQQEEERQNEILRQPYIDSGKKIPWYLR